MKALQITSLIAAGALTLAALLSTADAASSPASTAPTPIAGDFEVDGSHSSLIFRVQHMGASYFYGRFNEVSGILHLDEEDPSDSSAEVLVRAESVDTNSESRDKHVKGPDFLDAKQFPEISFVSKRVERTGGSWKMEGELTLHGTTKPITVDFEKVGEGKNRGGDRVVGFHAVFTIDRTDFGITYGPGALGAEIEMTVSLETTASK